MPWPWLQYREARITRNWWTLNESHNSQARLRTIISHFFSFILLIHEGSHGEVYQGFQPSYDIFRRSGAASIALLIKSCRLAAAFRQPESSIQVLTVLKVAWIQWSYENWYFQIEGVAAYQLGNTSSRMITEVKQRWARLVLGWETVQVWPECCC